MSARLLRSSRSDVDSSSFFLSPAPGKAARASSATVEPPVQRTLARGEALHAGDWHVDAGLAAAMGLASAPVQRMRSTGGSSADPEAIAGVAAHGLTGGAGPLPFREEIQRAFGHHDISSATAHAGPQASAAASALGAEAYATGSHVVFGGAPTLRTAAHEAAHVVQQRAGVHLLGGMDTPGDRYEAHADAVADRVVSGQSAEGLLDEFAGGASAHAGASVQRMTRDLEAQISYSDGQRMAVVGTRTQDLYATPELIAITNKRLEERGARIRLTAGASWLINPALSQVIVEVVDNKAAATGVSDQGVAGPFLQHLQPLASDTPEQRDEKTRKYRAFWRSQDKLLLLFSTEVLKFENRSYVTRLQKDIPRPRPGFTPKELRAAAEEAAKTLGGSRFAGTFFHTLITRNVLEELDAYVGKLRDKALSKEEIEAQIMAAREENAEDDPFASEEDEAPKDLVTAPPSDLERASGKEAAYQKRFDRGELWEHADSASLFLRSKITKLQEQIDEELEADGATLIAPKRCSDTTRWLYGADNLSSIPEDEGGGRLHYSQNVEGLGNVFHSAGAIMQDGDDLVTFESANGSGALPVGKHTWWFQMYGKSGTATSFAEQTKTRWASIA